MASGFPIVHIADREQGAWLGRDDMALLLARAEVISFITDRQDVVEETLVSGSRRLKALRNWERSDSEQGGVLVRRSPQPKTFC